MSKFNIENLLPNTNYSFQLSKIFVDEQLSYEIDLSTPKYATRMDKVGLSYKVLENKTIQEQVVNGASFYIMSWKVKSVSSGKSTVTFFVNSTNYSTLGTKDKIIFTTNSASALKWFNGSSATVNSVSFSTTQKQVEVINMVTSSFTPSSSGNVGSTESYPSPYTNYFTEFTTKSFPYNTYSIFINKENDFMNQLIWNDYVRDIIIFAYASADTATIGIENKYIIGTNEQINTKTPPLYANVPTVFHKRIKANHSQKWSGTTSGNVAFWAAVARYKKDSSSNWIGEWLHIDDNRNVIWTNKAVLS